MFKHLLLLFTIFLSVFAAPSFGQCDLSLDLNISSPVAKVFQNVTYTVTITNSGVDTAKAIIVKTPEQQLDAAFGLVFASATPSRGTYEQQFRNWNLAHLAPGQSESLQLVLFTMKPDLPSFYVQVIASQTIDSDSEPANGQINIVGEDDEAVIQFLPPATCQFEPGFVNLNCVTTSFGDQIYGYDILVSSTDPTHQFFEVSQVESFVNSFYIEANTPSVLFSGQLFLTQFEMSRKYYFRPFGSTGCVKTSTITMPSSCLNTEPPASSPCIIPSYYAPQVFCVNDGASYIMKLNLRDISIQYNGLAFSDAYEVFVDDVSIGTGIVQNDVLLGQNSMIFPNPEEPAIVRVERISDGRCISEGTVTPSDFCPLDNQAFCSQQAIYPWDEWIKRVKFGTFEKSSGKSQYSNFTYANLGDPSNTAFVQSGDSVPFQIEVGYSWTAHPDFVTIFLDTDRNGTFLNSEMIYQGPVPTVVSGPNASAVLSGKVKIPSDAVSGLSTMKVVLRRGAPATVCGSVPFGEVELYSVSIGGGAGTSNIDCAGLDLDILSIDCSDNGTPSLSADDTYTVNYRFDLTGKNGQVLYAGGYWLDPNGNYSGVGGQFGFQNTGTIGVPVQFGPISIANTPIFNFRAQSGLCATDYVLIEAPETCSNNAAPDPAANCTAQSVFPWEDWISRVTIGTFSNSSNKSTYTNFSQQTINLAPGAHPIAIRAAYSYFTFNEYARVWIDFNHNDIFEANEVAFSGSITKPINGIPFKDITGLLTVPNSAMPGLAKMRVRMSRDEYPLACGSQGFGEVEDYQVNIVTEGNKLINSDPIQALPIAIETRVFPNPASDLTYLVFTEVQDASVTLTDHLGNTVLTKQIINASQFEEIDLSQVANGHYLVKIQTQGARDIITKLVVARLY
jgi:uncharacterized repeat protein (TIGR01451 family)